MGYGEKLTDEAHDLLKRDWVRRFGKFAEDFFGGDEQKTSFCLKDSYNLRKWVSVQKTMQEISFAQALGQRDYVGADPLGFARVRRRCMRD